MYQLSNTRVETFASAACGHYRLLIAWPDGPAPKRGWPVMYLLDGERYFATAVSLLTAMREPRCGMTPGVIVAVDYDGPTRRDRDYRPAVERLIPEPDPAGGLRPLGEQGDAAGFRRFLLEELKPFIHQRYDIDSQRQALFGHSYGGLFTVDTLLEQPDSFQHFYASSPSVWWNGGYLSRQAEAFVEHVFVEHVDAQPLNTPVSLALSVGEHEQSLEAWEQRLPDERQRWLRQHRGQRRMVDGIRELATQLRLTTPLLTVSLHVYAEQSHMSASFPALLHALRHHFQPS
ncbi:alpha/beta hydrolase [Dickeya fangzhongdai]|uniref:alpha/beta hydrolase n=1 Tax=Dickeya fangzhongdai TaxID=1778540 RepID=UPI001ADC7FB9|nr:alpha/beta hydrolase-fold protein [Dickeya fangzhongdai]MBO8132913.1 alpha/beta hydrolase [Dickeya fangzhongdai]